MTVLDLLVDPPFGTDAPVKVAAKPIGIFIAILAAATGVLDLINLLSQLELPLFIASVGLVLALIAEVMVVVGGWRMFRGEAEGKRRVIYGLALAFAAEVIYDIGFGFAFGDDIVRFIVIVILYYLVAVSRHPAQRPVS